MSTNKDSVAIRKFLGHFGSSPVVCYANGNKPASSMIRTSIDCALYQNKKYQNDVYFYVNQGGTKQGQINKLTACFVDIDAGRDANKKYFKPSIVSLKKKKMLTAIKSCPCKPNFIVETRNGYQVYWLLSDTFNLPLWTKVQNKINNYFSDVGSDSRVTKVNQIMRLPYTVWHKQYEGKDPFKVRLECPIKKKYSLAELDNKFQTSAVLRRTYSNPSYNRFAQTYNVIGRGNKYVEKVRPKYNSRIDKFKTPQTIPQITPNETPSIKEFLKDVAQMLYYKKCYYLSKEAWRHYSSL
jgi:hypothetical protein